jgi:hypothetical protein
MTDLVFNGLQCLAGAVIRSAVIDSRIDIKEQDGKYYKFMRQYNKFKKITSKTYYTNLRLKETALHFLRTNALLLYADIVGIDADFLREKLALKGGE